MKWRLAVIIGLFVAAQSGRADVEFLWGITGARTASSLYQIDPKTGTVLTLVGATGANWLAGLAVHPGTRALYAANGSASPYGLFMLNKYTGAASLVGVSGKVIPTMTFSSAGVLYAWDQTSKKLVTLNLSTGTATTIGGNLTPSGTGLAFGPTGTLYLREANLNRLYTISPTTGLKLTGPVPLVAAVNFQNLLLFNSAGTLFTGVRTVSGTDLYTANPITGATNFAIRIPLQISGLAFDIAPTPTLAVTGKKKITTTRPTITLKGSATSILPLTISTKGKSTTAANGAWTLKLKLKRGKNIFTISGSDALGQSASGGRVTVIRK
jgi:hypothetical protein